MKKILAFLMALCMLLSVGVYADIELPLSVYVDGSKVAFPDAEPFVDSNNRTLVPVRFVSEALNATVEWDGNLRQVTITKEAKVVTLVIDKKEITVNGETKVLDSAPIISESRTFVPIRFVSEALDATVSWDGAVRTVYITTKKDEAEDNQNETTSIGGTEGKPFEVKVDADDKLNIADDGEYLAKDSGLAINLDNTSNDVISLHFFNTGKGDIVEAKEQTKDILSQEIQATTLKKVDDILSDCISNENHDAYEIIEDGKYSVVVMSSHQMFSIYVYEADR